ncbi:MAG: hypothetical protein FWC48_03740 [Actinomycetia bacterium]|nr:hypothetical protein [Actinomycetes bacterium]
MLIAAAMLPFQVSPPTMVNAAPQSAEEQTSVEATTTATPSEETTEGAVPSAESTAHAIAKAAQTVVVSGDLSGVYDTLTAAIAAINNHGGASYTVTVMQNEAIANLAIKKKVNLSSAAGTTAVISNAVDNRHFTVNAGGALTLKDITLQGTTQTAGNTAAGGIHVMAQGQLTIEAGTTIKGVAPANVATSAMFGGAVYCSGTCVMNGGTLTGNKISVVSGSGAGIYLRDATASFTLNGGTISNNTAASGVGVAVAGGATFTMNGGAITGNTGVGTSVFGVGVRIIEAGSSFKMFGGTISNNVSTATGSSGGGVAVMQGKPSFLLQGGTIEGNKAVNEGGGVFIADSTVTLNSGAINNNSASEGGGVFVPQSGGSFSMNGGAINGNSATARSAGAVYLGPQANFTFKDGEICNNSAVGIGGAVVIFGYNTLTLSNMKLDGNKSDMTGGAIYLPHTSTLIASNTVFSNNFAKVDGGAIHSTMGGDYKNLDLAASVKFFLNSSVAPYPPRADALTYFPKIKTTSSSVYNHPVNCFDINYMEGTPGVAVTVRYIDRAGRPVGDPNRALYAITKNSTFTLTAAQMPQISGYTFAAWRYEANGTLQYSQNIAVSNVSASVTLYLIYDEIPQIDVSVPVKLIFAAFRSDKGAITAPSYYLQNRGQTPVEVKLTSFTVDVSAGLVLTSDPKKSDELALKLQGLGAANDWLTPGSANKALGTIPVGDRTDFTLSGRYTGGYFAAKTPRYFVTFEFSADL